MHNASTFYAMQKKGEELSTYYFYNLLFFTTMLKTQYLVSHCHVRVSVSSKHKALSFKMTSVISDQNKLDVS